MSQTFDFIINRRAGTVMAAGEDRVVSDLQAAFKEKAGQVHLIEGGEIAPMVKTWLQTANTAHRSLIIGGGDGSLLTAAAEVINTDVALGLLPLGTQNFLARNMGFSSDYREAAHQYTNSTPRPVDVGMVNGQYFLYGLLFDDNCVRFFEAREDMRAQRPFDALKKAFDSVSGLLLHPQMHVRIEVPGHTRYISGRVFGVTNNPLAPRSTLRLPLFAPALDVVGNIFAKSPEGQGKLAFYALRAGFRGIEIVPSIVEGTWNNHPQITTFESPRFKLKPVGIADGEETSIILDGEIKQTTLPLEVSILPGALRLYQNMP